MYIKKIKLSVLVTKFGNGHAPKDEKFIELFKLAMETQIPHYWAMIEAGHIKPFSNFKPKISQEMRDYFQDEFIAGKFPSIYVYQEGGNFIMSDDYQKYYVYVDMGSKFIPCFILGKPNGDYVHKEIQIAPPEPPEYGLFEGEEKKTSHEES